MPPWVLARTRAPGGAPPGWSQSVLGRSQALVAWAERNPRTAFMAGIEPLAIEARVLLDGSPTLSSLGRQRDLQAEACRRAEAREQELAAAPGKDVLGTIGTGLSIASSVVMILATVA